MGNPSSEHSGSRHNLGFIALAEIIRRHRLRATAAKLNGRLYKGRVADFPTLAFYPNAFMNLCGAPISEAVRFYKLPLERLVVIHDDTELPLGRVKAKMGGGDGGHRGIRSIDESLGSELGNNYARIRLGIGRPLGKKGMSAYVLGGLTGKETSLLKPLLERVAAGLPILLGGDMSGFMQTLIEQK